MSVPSLEKASFLMAETDPAKVPAAAAEVAFVGRSNSGKSSLINALCRKDLARTSSTPGRTRTINAYRVDERSLLVDLPGYGFATGPEAERAGWGKMIEGYLLRRPSLKAALVLLDAKIGPTKLDVQMLQWLQAEGVPWRVVAAKTDQVQPSRALVRRREVAAAAGVAPDALGWVSAKDGAGIKDLRLELQRLLGAA